MTYPTQQEMTDSSAAPQKRSLPEPVYLYCLIPAPPPQHLTGKGIDNDQSLFAHTLDNITAILSGIDVEAFTGPAAEANLQDINWVAPRAALHAEVVAQMMKESSVLPVRFGTIYSSCETMVHALDRHRDTIWAFLTEMGQKKEFALKAYMDRQTVLQNINDSALAEASEKMAAMAPGARYFEEKRILRHSEALLDEWLHHACQTIADQLHIPPSDLAELKVQTRHDSGRQLEMIFNWAILIPDGDRQLTTDRIAGINTSWKPMGITLECTGPWPPYSFCPQLNGEA